MQFIIEAAYLNINKNIVKNVKQSSFFPKVAESLLEGIEKKVSEKIGTYTHNYWCLTNIEKIDPVTGYGTPVAALHGLATDRSTGAVLAVGYSNKHSIRVHHYVSDLEFLEAYPMANKILNKTCNLPMHGRHTVYSGSVENCLSKWFEAISRGEKFNSLDLDYPKLGGVFMKGQESVNSNTVYAMLGKVMQLEPYQFPGTNPSGIDSSLPDNVQTEIFGDLLSFKAQQEEAVVEKDQAPFRGPS